MLFADNYWCCCCFSFVLKPVLSLYKTCMRHFNVCNCGLSVCNKRMWLLICYEAKQLNLTSNVCILNSNSCWLDPLTTVITRQLSLALSLSLTVAALRSHCICFSVVIASLLFLICLLIFSLPHRSRRSLGGASWNFGKRLDVGVIKYLITRLEATNKVFGVILEGLLTRA